MHGRWHFVQDEAGFEYSILFSRGEEGDRTRLLLKIGGHRYDLLSAQDPTGLDSTESVTDVETGETWKRRLIVSDYQAVAGCSAVKPPDLCLLFEGTGGSYATSLARFHAEGGVETRRRAAATVSDRLATTLRALEPLMGVTVELDAYGADFLRLVWPDRFASHGRAATKARRTDGCAFDATFGHPCG